MEFCPLRSVKHKQKKIQEKICKPNQIAANVMCLQQHKCTYYWEEH